ncbi:hypothetical protein [uncultured Methanospirillum sp.]|uniref:hypothetical protein n=1 Tax=uncultured Methanospirillum sp. TaxID=262503 RepID=UPI0029C80E75|nr:hypothetical protein [uncultured Methanospirillum sp.]
MTREFAPYIGIYADFLGMKNRFDEEKNNISDLNYELNKFIELIKLNLEIMKGLPEIMGGISKIFSDNFLFLSPIKDIVPWRPEISGINEIITFSQHFSVFQLAFACEGYYLRGGMDMGWFYHENEDIAIGPLLTSLDSIEKWSHNPIIYTGDIINKWIDEITEYLGPDNITTHHVWFIKDYQQKFFLNYLNAIFLLADFNMHDSYQPNTLLKKWPVGKEYLEKHKNHIIHHIKNPKIYTKFLWLAQYHNWFCKKHFYEHPDLVIKCKDLVSIAGKFEQIERTN